MKLLAFIVLELALAVPAFAQAPAAPPAAAPASDAVVRAVFTTAVADREPADQITSLKNDVPQVYFYTELIDLEGQTVTHKWEYAGEVKAEVRFDVKAPRWRVWSSKKLDPSWTGEWTVSVVDGSGATRAQAKLNYEKAGP
ncbi:MAG: DUF2914 domain-containing protein [Nitrospirae bacterium]|nr:MAG: DUF2914 domain-containing protein [Nitrospirota bacterium]